MHTVSALLRETEALFAEVGGEVVVDLGSVTRADSAGLALLIEWLRLARRQNLTITYRNLPAQLLQIAHVSELQDVLPIQA